MKEKSVLDMTTFAPQTMRPRQVLLCVQGTAQFLAAIAAAKYREQLFPNQPTEYILVVYDLLARQQDAPFTQAIFELAEPWSLSRQVFLDATTLNQLVKSFQPRSQKIQQLRDLIGVQQVDEIYLCRNYIGYGSNFLLNAYAQAIKITYGDSYGLVCSRTFFEKNTYVSRTAWKRTIDSWQQHFKYSLKRFIGWELPTLQFDLALLTTPIDYCGEFLRQVDYQFVPLQVLEKVLQVTKDAIASRHTQYVQTVLGGHSIDLLLLTSTLTESNYTGLENEVALYVNRVQNLVTPGSTIAIKPHPRTSAATTEYLQVELTALGYSVYCLTDQAFNFIPIEVSIHFLQPRLVVGFVSTAAISLALFAETQQIAIHDELILAQYLNSSAIASILDFQRMLAACLDTIELGWRGGKVLWSRSCDLPTNS